MRKSGVVVSPEQQKFRSFGVYTQITCWTFLQFTDWRKANFTADSMSDKFVLPGGISTPKSAVKQKRDAFVRKRPYI